MGIFGRLLGTTKAVDDIIDKDSGLLVKAGTALGNLHYSEQEKAEDAKEIRSWGLRQLEALAPFKVVQRIIAFTVLSGWAFVLVNLVASIWVESYTRELVNVDGQQLWIGINAKTDLMALALSDYVFWPTVAVLSLYMTGGVVNFKKGEN